MALAWGTAMTLPTMRVRPAMIRTAEESPAREPPAAEPHPTVMMRLRGAVLLLLVVGCAASTPAARRTTSAPPSSLARSSSSGPALFDCGSFTLSQGEDLPDSAVTCFLAAHAANRAARLERTAPTVEGRPVREEYVTDDTALIAVTVDMSQDPYSGNRIERKVCSRVAAIATGHLAFAGCTLR
jgi:hypothetical protein